MIYFYDNTFEGFLSVIFECFQQSISPDDIRPELRMQRVIFCEHVKIISDPQKAERVWLGFRKKMNNKKSNLPFYAFLSEVEGIEMNIFRFSQRLFSEKAGVENDFSDHDVLLLNQEARKVQREAMRIIQFVRFQRTKDGLYFCGIEPRYDVIPLVIKHYKKRFPDQKWIIYDLKRDYGIFNSLHEIQELTITKKEFNKLNGALKKEVLNEEEVFYQDLWRTYFKYANIKERKNLKLQRQHMPQRFWKFLPEMNENIINKT